MRRRLGLVRTRPSALRAAALGALAGLGGGVAMLIAQAVERQLGLDEPDSAWERAVRREAAAQGRRLSERRVGTLAAGSRLLYAAGLGAAYGLLRGRLRLPRMSNATLLSGLVYAINLPGRDGARRPRSLLAPLFGFATARIYEALAER
jgi:hypothetical protein